MLRPPRKARAPERLLLYGGPGQGKSGCWIDIAQKMYESGNPGKVVVIDTDNAVEAMFGEGYDHLEKIVIPLPCFDWTDLRNAQSEIINMDLGYEDWLVHDMISFPYTEVRRHYTELVHGKDIEEYLIETATLISMAKAEKQGHERQFGDYNTADWVHMGKIYLNYEVPLTLRMKCHVMAIAEEREVDANRGAKPDQVKRYKKVGAFKPYVNNTAEHRFRSVLRVKAPGDHFELMMAKDRYRQERWVEEAKRNTLDIGDMNEDGGFVNAYLIPIAKWRNRTT